MAKINFQKLNLKINTEVTTLEWDQDLVIEVKQYLPLENKITIIENVINFCLSDSEHYYNPVAVAVLKDMSLIEQFTNISFTEQQKKKIFKTYDMLVSSGLLAKIIALIPEQELAIIDEYLAATLQGIYTYNNSVHGVLNLLNEEYNTVNLDAEGIKQTLASNSKEILALKDMLSQNA